MANVLQPQIEFHPRPVAHAPSPFGFGFGLGPSLPQSWHSPALSSFAVVPTHSSLARSHKRRHDPEEDDSDVGRYATERDDSMDRSPTPERPKRAAPKRARVVPLVEKDDNATKENKSPRHDDPPDVDVGVLLASLPPQSLLPLLTSLLVAQPSLKSSILPLIPRPTLDTAVQALAQSAKKLRDAYPYSNVPSFSHPGPSTTFGFGKPPNQAAFGQPHQANGGMRDSYILSRLRPHITEFVAACISYLPYFSYVPSSLTSTPTSDKHSQPYSTTLQSLHRDKSHPSETYIFLSTVTNHYLSQPPLAQSLLAPLLLPRLSEEWVAWVDRVDEVVNRQGGMFGSETVHGWERGLDELAGGKGTDIMRMVRERWVGKVGWLVGRSVSQAMEEV